MLSHSLSVLLLTCGQVWKRKGGNYGRGKRGSERERERSEGEGDDEMRELQRTRAKQLFYSPPQPVRKATETE